MKIRDLERRAEAKYGQMVADEEARAEMEAKLAEIVTEYDEDIRKVGLVFGQWEHGILFKLRLWIKKFRNKSISETGTQCRHPRQMQCRVNQKILSISVDRALLNILSLS